MFYSFVPGKERFTPESASVRPAEAGLHLGGKSPGAQKQPRIPVSNSVSGEGQLDCRRSAETGELRESNRTDVLSHIHAELHSILAKKKKEIQSHVAPKLRKSFRYMKL